MKRTYIVIPEKIMSVILPLEAEVYGAVHRAVYLYLRDEVLPEEGSLAPSASVIFSLLRRELDRIVARRRRAAERRARRRLEAAENQAQTTQEKAPAAAAAKPSSILTDKEKHTMIFSLPHAADSHRPGINLRANLRRGCTTMPSLP